MLHAHFRKNNTADPVDEMPLQEAGLNKLYNFAPVQKSKDLR